FSASAGLAAASASSTIASRTHRGATATAGRAAGFAARAAAGLCSATRTDFAVRAATELSIAAHSGLAARAYAGRRAVHPGAAPLPIADADVGLDAVSTIEAAIIVSHGAASAPAVIIPPEADGCVAITIVATVIIVVVSIVVGIATPGVAAIPR